jgi:hypothetical protein
MILARETQARQGHRERRYVDVSAQPPGAPRKCEALSGVGRRTPNRAALQPPRAHRVPRTGHYTCRIPPDGYVGDMNRFFRRMQQFGKSFSARRSQSQMTDQSDELYRANTPQDVTDPRAKSQGHGKKTADKWNQ